ncbi:type II toxin-antitoxin system VapC family toxin [soil metagenome]
MKYVVDASVTVRWELNDSDSDKARRLRVAYAHRIHELFAPETIVWETANSLLKAERQKNIPPGEAEFLYYDFLRTQPILTSAGPFVARAMRIALRAHAGLYDVFYVLLAQREQCELVTADQRLINNLQPAFPFIRPLSSMP